MLFESLKIWNDKVSRTGPENMAVDEWLMKSVDEIPVLRLYLWEGDWISLGYFQSLVAAKEIFGDSPRFVRRWTGGGVVDHRNDLTYTLAIPRCHQLARSRGNESYCEIHRAIARCLGEGGIACQLTREDSTNDSPACFEKPVAWDLVGEKGQKLAGAGQRRTRWGTLHQGSVAASEGALDRLGEVLSPNPREISSPDPRLWEGEIEKYQSRDWLSRVS